MRKLLNCIMSQFVDILEGQIDEARKTRPRTPATDSDSRKIIQKKKMIPLKADMEIQSDEIPTPEEEPKKVHPPADPPQTRRSPQKRVEPVYVEKGGMLWGTPEENAEIRKSMTMTKPKAEGEGTCLMDLIMAPPPKELKPTLFTYFDKLMANGEV